MMRVRERQKEEEVEALKRSMQSGLVSFCLIIVVIAFSLFIVLHPSSFPFELPGASNERASSTSGRDGLPVQDRKL